MSSLIKKFQKHRELVQWIVDIAAVVAAYIFAFLVRLDFVITGDYLTRYWPALLRLMPVVLLLNWLAMQILQLSRSLWLYTSIEEVFRIGFSVLLGNGAWFIIVLIAKFDGYIRSVPVIGAIVQLFIMLGVRLGYRMYRKSQVEKNAVHRAIILGAGSAGVRVLREITIREKYQCRVVGFLDKNPDKVGKLLNGVPVLGDDSQLESIVEKYDVDTAYIAIRNITKSELRSLIEACRACNLRTRIVSIEFRENAETTASIRNVKIDDLLGRGELSLNNNEIVEYLRGKTVMVTGAGGSIGSELVRQIMSFNPDRLVLVDIYENTMYELQQEIVIGRRTGVYQTYTDVVCLIGSVRDSKRINQIIEKYHPEVVYHAAAHKHVPLVEDSPLESLKNNVFGTYNVVQACIKGGVKKFVLISTDKAVRTTNVMGASKRMCELIVEGYKNNGVTKLCAVRFGNVLGSHGSVIPLFEKQIAAGGPVTVTDPNIIRYFMTIPEAAQLVLQAGVYAQSGEIFILDMGKPVKIVDLARNLIQLSGLRPDEDIEIKFTGLRPGEKLYEELLVDTKTANKTANNLIFIADPENISVEQVEAKLAQFRDMIDNNLVDNANIIRVVNAGTSTEGSIAK